MQRLISDSLVLIATDTEDSRVAYRFLCVILQAAHARDSLISGACSYWYEYFLTAGEDYEPLEPLFLRAWIFNGLSNRQTCFRKRGFPGMLSIRTVNVNKFCMEMQAHGEPPSETKPVWRYFPVASDSNTQKVY